MTVTLTQGGNAPLPAGLLQVRMSWTAPTGLVLDPSAFLLTAAGKVRGDADMVFFNQMEGDGGAITVVLNPSSARFTIQPDQVSPAIERIAFVLVIEEAESRRQSFAQLSRLELEVTDPSGTQIARFAPDLAAAIEASLIVAELYRRQGQWKLRAVAQGFRGGLAPLARSFGIDVAEPAAPAAPPAPPAPLMPPPGGSAPPPAPGIPPPPPPPPRPVTLGKVTLTKPRESVDLRKRQSGFDRIRVNLNWERGPMSRGLFGRSGGIDLDLGCLWEMQDGAKGIIQALGKQFGALERPPFVMLAGDDRTGDVTTGEDLIINGRFWTRIRRVVVYAYIYDGAANWATTNGVIRIEVPGEPEIEMALTEGDPRLTLCGCVLLENNADGLKVTRVVEYFTNQEQLDRTFGWGLTWSTGKK